MFEHPLSAVYNVAHGAGLAVVMLGWLEFKKADLQDRIIKFGEKILGLKDVVDVDEVIKEFRSWIKFIGCPVTLGELGIENPDIPELIGQARKLSRLWGIDEYSDADMEVVYRLCM
jgi:hypothetical protein